MRRDSTDGAFHPTVTADASRAGRWAARALLTRRPAVSLIVGIVLIAIVGAPIDWGFPCYPMFATDSFLDPVRLSPRVQKVLDDLKVQWERYREALR